MKIFKFIFVFSLLFLLAGCTSEKDPVIEEKPDDPVITPEPVKEKITHEDVLFWLESLYKNIVINNDFQFAKTYPDSDIVFDIVLNNTYNLQYDGKYTAPITDVFAEVEFYYTIDGVEYMDKIPYVIKGFTDKIGATMMWLTKMLPKELSVSTQLFTECDEYGTTLSWYENGEEIKNSYYIISNALKEDYDTVLTCCVKYNDEMRSRDYNIHISSLTDAEKALKVIDELNSLYKNTLVYDNLELPKSMEEYNATISWKSWQSNAITDDGIYIEPLKDIKVKMQVMVKVNKETKLSNIIINVKGENKMDNWEKIEAFLNRINIKNVKNQRYYLFGWEPGYTQIPTVNYGYLPFYVNEELSVTQDILPDDSPMKPVPRRMRASTNYITIHNTGMGEPTANAKGLNEYIHTTTREASWHFSVDDFEAYQELLLDEVGWHAGDGSHMYGDYWQNSGVWCIGGGNNNSVGLETCVYYGCDYNMVMRNTAKLVSKLLVTYNLTVSDVRQHYDFSGKNCPQVLREAKRWAEQLELIDLEYYARTQLKGVDFVWESLTPEIMDNKGRVLSTRPNEATTVKYKVTVTCNGESKEFNFESVLDPMK